MAALMCAHKLTWMYTFAHHLQFVCTHCVSINVHTHAHTHTYTHTHTLCLQENKIFCQGPLSMDSLFSHRLHFAAVNMGQIQTHGCLQRLYTDNTVRASSGLLKLSCQHMFSTCIYFYPLFCWEYKAVICN